MVLGGNTLPVFGFRLHSIRKQSTRPAPYAEVQGRVNLPQRAVDRRWRTECDAPSRSHAISRAVPAF